MIDLLIEGPERPQATLLLAHGAGAPMDSAFMGSITALLAAGTVQVIRFEFPYMAARRSGSRKPPPPRAEKMVDFFAETATGLDIAGPLMIGGKSYGGRVASLAAQSLYDAGVICALVAISYPFHPPGRPEALRTAHLADMTVPALICQGERDPFGSKSEVAAYQLPPSISLHWAGDGDHDLKPRKKSGLTVDRNWQETAAAIAAFAGKVTAATDSGPGTG